MAKTKPRPAPAPTEAKPEEVAAAAKKTRAKREPKAKGTEITTAKPPRTPVAKLDAQLAPITNLFSPALEKEFGETKRGSLEYRAEQRYALEILTKPDNDYLRTCALENPISLYNALLNTARLGLSLNPVLGHAYLIPTKDGGTGTVHLAPSYKGFEAVALASGMVKFIQTDEVYAGDEFRRWNDEHGAHFEHVPARGDRGAFEGAYTLAVYANGGRHLEYMSALDIKACEDAATRKNKGALSPAWKYFPSEMRKKCPVRRGAKHWPTNNDMTLAMKLMDEADPMDFDDTPHDPIDASGSNNHEAEMCVSEKDIDAIRIKLAPLPMAQVEHWLQQMAIAMGFQQGPLYVTVSKLPEFERRLMERKDKVIRKAVEPKEPAAEGAQA